MFKLIFHNFFTLFFFLSAFLSPYNYHFDNNYSPNQENNNHHSLLENENLSAQDFLDNIQPGYRYNENDLTIIFSEDGKRLIYIRNSYKWKDSLFGEADFSNTKFRNLETIQFLYTQITSIKISENINLRNIIFDYSALTAIFGLEKITNLNWLDLLSNNLSNLDLSRNEKLERLDLRANNYHQLTVQLPFIHIPSNFKHDNDNIIFQMFRDGKNFFPINFGRFNIFYLENQTLKMDDEEKLFFKNHNNWDKYWKTGEDWSYQKESQLRQERKIKNWYDFQIDFLEKGELNVKNFIYWLFEDWRSNKYIVPVWWEFIDPEKRDQKWIDKIKRGDNYLNENGRTLHANNLEIIGKINLYGPQFQELEVINLQNNKISEVDLTHNHYLVYLNLINNQQQLKIKLAWQFDQQEAFFNHDDDVIIEQEKRPEKNAQKWLDQQNKNIKYLQGSNLNLVGKIRFLNFPNLETLWLFNNKLTEIDISWLPNLKTLFAKKNSGATIIFKDQPQKEKITLNYDANKQEIKYFWDTAEGKYLLEKGKEYFSLKEETIRKMKYQELQNLKKKIKDYEEKHPDIFIPTPIYNFPPPFDPMLPLPQLPPIYWFPPLNPNKPTPPKDDKTKNKKHQNLLRQLLPIWILLIFLVVLILGVFIYKKSIKKDKSCKI